MTTALAHYNRATALNGPQVRGGDDDEADPDVPGFINELKRAVPPGFRPKGNVFVFVDECHRTQSGVFHDAMKELPPTLSSSASPARLYSVPTSGAAPCRQVAQRRDFGRYIHRYLFREAVSDGVILDLLARDIDQRLLSPVVC